MNLTFQEFQKEMYKLNPDPIPEIIEDGWIYQVSEAVKSGVKVTQKVLKSHSEIYFDKDGNAFYKTEVKK